MHIKCHNNLNNINSQNANITDIYTTQSTPNMCTKTIMDLPIKWHTYPTPHLL